MVKPHAVSTALAAIAIAATTKNNVQAFQPSRPVALSPLAAKIDTPFATSSTSFFRTVADININNLHQRRTTTSINMTPMSGQTEPSQPSRKISLFGKTSQRTRLALQKARRTFTILLASFAFFLCSTRVHSPPAHASSTAAVASSSTLSLTQKLNPFRTRSADEMIDAYVRDRLFADDQFDPVESAYREAYADYAGGQQAGKENVASATSPSSGAYPTLLAETATSALGTQKSVSSVLSSSTSRSVGTSSKSGKDDGITAVLIKASDILQSKLRVSASVSYYILAGGGIFGICVIPGMLGVLYQGIQRLQIDKSEMKMYGKISDMDATSKKISDDDDDDDDEE